MASLRSRDGEVGYAHENDVGVDAGCEERLESPHKLQECRACVERPVPHEYLPDNPDGERCVRR